MLHVESHRLDGLVGLDGRIGQSREGQVVTVKRLRTEEVMDLPVTVDILTAARAFGLGRTVAYGLAKRDEFPCRVFRAGGRYVVARGDLLRALGLSEPAA